MVGSKVYREIFHISITVGRVSNMVLETQKPEKKPEPENSGPGRAGFHLIKFQVSQVRPEKTRKFQVMAISFYQWQDMRLLTTVRSKNN